MNPDHISKICVAILMLSFPIWVGLIKFVIEIEFVPMSATYTGHFPLPFNYTINNILNKREVTKSIVNSSSFQEQITFSVFCFESITVMQCLTPLLECIVSVLDFTRHCILG